MLSSDCRSFEKAHATCQPGLECPAEKASPPYPLLRQTKRAKRELGFFLYQQPQSVSEQRGLDLMIWVNAGYKKENENCIARRRILLLPQPRSDKIACNAEWNARASNFFASTSQPHPSGFAWLHLLVKEMITKSKNGIANETKEYVHLLKTANLQFCSKSLLASP